MSPNLLWRSGFIGVKIKESLSGIIPLKKGFIANDMTLNGVKRRFEMGVG